MAGSRERDTDRNMADRDDDEKRAGLAETAGRAAFLPARAAARVWRRPLESAAEDVLSAPELARIVDRALAGPLPEELARSLVRHRVLERVVQELAESGELQRLVEQALSSPQTVELTDKVLASDEMQRALRSVASSDALRDAVAQQSLGFADEVVGAVRSSAAALDEVTARPFRRLPRAERSPYAGIVSRAVALVLDVLASLAIFVLGSAVVALIGSLVGGIRPHWVVGTLLSVGWIVVAVTYFTLFWSAAGRTPGMRLMHLHVRHPGGDGVSTRRALRRTIGLIVAIIPLFLGFVPALFDRRRRALPDFLAGTVVVYDDAENRSEEEIDAN
jgi:uncharacterized RDD family membrane protein YckC